MTVPITNIEQLIQSDFIEQRLVKINLSNLHHVISVLNAVLGEINVDLWIFKLLNALSVEEPA